MFMSADLKQQLNFGVSERLLLKNFGQQTVNRMRFGDWASLCFIELDKFGRRTYIKNKKVTD